MDISLTMITNKSEEHFYENDFSLQRIDENDTMNISDSIWNKEVPSPPMYILLSVSIIYSLIFVVGISGNVFIICSVCCLKDMQTRMGYMFMNLSLTDILILVVCMPSTAMDLFLKNVWYLGGFACKFVSYCENTVTLASVLTILAITVDRYNGICGPTSDTKWKRCRVAKIVIAIWSTACIASLPILFIMIYKDSILLDGTPVKVCRQYINTTWKKGYMVLIFCLFFVVTMIVLSVLIYCMTRSLLMAPNLYEGQTDKRCVKSIQSRRKVVIMLALVILSFFVCLLPQRIVGLWFIFSDYEAKMKLGFEGILNLLTFVRVMMYLNSALNPVIYNAMSTKFRRVLLLCTLRWKPMSKRHRFLYYNGHSTVVSTHSSDSIQRFESRTLIKISRTSRTNSQRCDTHIY